MSLERWQLVWDKYPNMALLLRLVKMPMAFLGVLEPSRWLKTRFSWDRSVKLNTKMLVVGTYLVSKRSQDSRWFKPQLETWIVSAMNCSLVRHFGALRQVHLLDFPNIVIKGSELSLPFQAPFRDQQNIQGWVAGRDEDPSILGWELDWATLW